MYSYIMRRLTFGAVTIIGVSIIVFMVLRILPGDPLVAIFGPEGFTKLSEADRAHYRAELGLSDPLVVHYLSWVGDIARGNFEIETIWGSRHFSRRHGEALHSAREPLTTLDRIRRTIGEYNFAGQYQQSPAPWAAD